MFADDVGVAFAAADLDGDGDTDVVVHRPSTGSVHTLLNSGGALVDSFALTAADGPACALDFDGDGDTDIALAQPNQTVVLLNAGDGSLSFGPMASMSGGITVPACGKETSSGASPRASAKMSVSMREVPGSSGLDRLGGQCRLRGTPLA